VGYAVKVRIRQVSLPVYLLVQFHLYSLLISTTDISKQMLEWYFNTYSLFTLCKLTFKFVTPAGANNPCN